MIPIPRDYVSDGLLCGIQEAWQARHHQRMQDEQSGNGEAADLNELPLMTEAVGEVTILHGT